MKGWVGQSLVTAVRLGRLENGVWAFVFERQRFSYNCRHFPFRRRVTRIWGASADLLLTPLEALFTTDRQLVGWSYAVSTRVHGFSSWRVEEAGGPYVNEAGVPDPTPLPWGIFRVPQDGNGGNVSRDFRPRGNAVLSFSRTPPVIHHWAHSNCSFACTLDCSCKPCLWRYTWSHICLW